ncbi:MAG: ammonium transporter [Gammaproteobacteria bacterium]|nr:ammonium transporter [Gammaproteobacteria bacterium]MDH3428427.1 ammonium transporter [Gammaproteobacteria bacterium]
MTQFAATLLLFLLVPGLTFAADGLDSGDTAWMLTATALVLFMTLPGLALFYSGLVRNRNVLSVMMQCFTIACAASLLWVIAGYSLIFGEGSLFGGLTGGLDQAFLSGVTSDSLSGTIPETVFVMFQMTFAIITPALIVGAFAERIRFSAMLLFCLLWLMLVYVPVAHWVWGGGWLAERGFMDYAGGAVVHINAGIAALVAALMIGNRRGFPTTQMAPHNLPWTVAGACMLWVGWFGFNAGSAVASNGAAGMAMLVTHLGAASGSLAWMCCEWLRFGKPSVLGIATGMVAGLGTITPASGFVGPGGAIVIGLLAGVVCFFATMTIKRKLQIDDSLDVFPVHGVGGMLGILLTSVFVSANYGGMGLPDGVSIGQQFVVQLTGMLATILWCGGMTFILLKLINIVLPLRVSADEETQGLDLVEHDERGYDI